jgi:aspartate-semialdehyde dehydrogenase
MEDDTIKVSATCVRIPVMSGHSESVYIETERAATVAEIQALMEKAAGVVLEDDPSQQIYPQALNSVGKNETFVGRIRKDPDEEKGVHMWVVSDNLLKGAAWNSLQIAETMYEMDLLN